jgi:two-component system, chemotaxis family, protein-glutamate methylesterase/glutaminase
MNVDQKIKVLIADDTALYRKILSMAVAKIDSAEIIGTASDGIQTLEILKKKPADLVLLDVCMPRMDGIEALKEIHKTYPNISVVMLSGVTTADADTTVEALEIGALEFIPKPKTRSLDESMNLLSHELTRIVRLIKIRKISKRISSHPTPSIPEKTSAERTSPVRFVPRAPTRFVKFDIARSLVVIGVSTGGPNALNQLMLKMPKQLGCPVLIVQHMPPFFTASLASFLSKKSGLNVKEGEHGEIIKPDYIYIAPGGKHMVIEKQSFAGGGYQLSMNENPPVNSCRPAVDVLFNSVAEQFAGSVLSIILTGMGEDGTEGVATLKRSPNCYSIAQDEASCVVYGMPRAVFEKGVVDEVLPLDQIASRISELILKRKVS